MTVSLRTVLTVGFALFVITLVGGIGAIGVYGSISNALDVTRQFQTYRAKSVSEKVNAFFSSVEAETSVLYNLFASNPRLLENESARGLLAAFIANLDSVRDLTLVRRDRTNVMVYWDDDGEISSEFDGELDEESIEIMLEGRPGDDTEGFEDLYIEPTDKRPVISYTLHLADLANTPLGTIYLDLDVTTLSEAIARSATEDDGYLFMMDRRGVVMAHPELLTSDDRSAWSKLPRVKDLADPVPAAVLRSINRSGDLTEQIAPDGEPYLTAVSELSDTGDSSWYVVSVVPRSAVLGDAYRRA